MNSSAPATAEIASADARARKAPKKPRSETAKRGRGSLDLTPMKAFLASLDVGVTPTLHVNGHSYSTAIVTVDFGSPLTPIKLTQEQTQDLTDRLRRLARDIIGRDANVRVSHDSSNGIFWAGTA